MRELYIIFFSTIKYNKPREKKKTNYVNFNHQQFGRNIITFIIIIIILP